MLARGRVAELPTGRDVRLRLDCTGAGTTRIALFADDEKVAEAKDRDALRYGSVGMLVSAEEPPADVLFEDFVLLGRRRHGLTQQWSQGSGGGRRSASVTARRSRASLASTSRRDWVLW